MIPDRVVPLDRVRYVLDERPGLHRDCVPEDMHRAEVARRVDAEQRAADAESQGRTNFDMARRTVERRTQQRDDARAYLAALLAAVGQAVDELRRPGADARYVASSLAGVLDAAANLDIDPACSCGWIDVNDEDLQDHQWDCEVTRWRAARQRLTAARDAAGSATP